MALAKWIPANTHALKKLIDSFISSNNNNQVISYKSYRRSFSLLSSCVRVHVHGGLGFVVSTKPHFPVGTIFLCSKTDLTVISNNAVYV